MLIVKCKLMYYVECGHSKCHYLSVVVPPGAYNKNLILTAASIDCGSLTLRAALDGTKSFLGVRSHFVELLESDLRVVC
jgi:hypothetical protein